MDILRVGIVGTGRISDLHAIEYLANPRAKIVAVCDTNLDIAKQRGAAWGVADDHIFSSYHDLLALKDVDLVEILLPHHLHYQAALDAAKAGQTYLAAKTDGAQSHASGRDDRRREKSWGDFQKVFENFIFYPPVQCAKTLIDRGEIRHPADDLHQEQFRHQPDHVANPALRGRMALRPGT